MLLYQKWNVTILGQKNKGILEKVKNKKIKMAAVIQALTLFAHTDACKGIGLQS